jgi:hypothetical protein
MGFRGGRTIDRYFAAAIGSVVFLFSILKLEAHTPQNFGLDCRQVITFLNNPEKRSFRKSLTQIMIDPRNFFFRPNYEEQLRQIFLFTTAFSSIDSTSSSSSKLISGQSNFLMLYQLINPVVRRMPFSTMVDIQIRHPTPDLGPTDFFEPKIPQPLAVSPETKFFHGDGGLQFMVLNSTDAVNTLNALASRPNFITSSGSPHYQRFRDVGNKQRFENEIDYLTTTVSKNRLRRYILYIRGRWTRQPVARLLDIPMLDPLSKAHRHRIID